MQAIPTGLLDGATSNACGGAAVPRLLRQVHDQALLDCLSRMHTQDSELTHSLYIAHKARPQHRLELRPARLSSGPVTCSSMGLIWTSGETQPQRTNPSYIALYGHLTTCSLGPLGRALPAGARKRTYVVSYAPVSHPSDTPPAQEQVNIVSCGGVQELSMACSVRQGSTASR